MGASLAKTTRFAALRHRNFALLWAGAIVSNIGTWMQNVGQSWLVLQLTNSPLWLGLLGLSFAIPMVILPLVGGAVADRVHRIRLLYVTQSGQMLLAFALAVLTWLGAVSVWHILLASFLGASLLAFDNPARQALVYDLVLTQDLLDALSLNSATYTVLHWSARRWPGCSSPLSGRQPSSSSTASASSPSCSPWLQCTRRIRTALTPRPHWVRPCEPAWPTQ